MMKRFQAYCVLAGFLALAPAGCGGEGGEASATEDACEHMTLGPFAAITASASVLSDPPDVADHTRVDVTLVGDADEEMARGFVELMVAEAGEVGVFLNQDVRAQLLDSAMEEVAPTSSTAEVGECSEVAVATFFDLAVASYVLELGPSAQAEVSLVVIPAGEDEHDHE